MDHPMQRKLSNRATNPRGPIWSTSPRVNRPGLSNPDHPMAEYHRVPALESTHRYILVPVDSSGKCSLVESTSSSSTSSPRSSELQLATDDIGISRRKSSTISFKDSGCFA